MFAAYLKEGLDAVEILGRSVEVTKEFEYDSSLPNVRDRIKPVRQRQACSGEEQNIERGLESTTAMLRT